MNQNSELNCKWFKNNVYSIIIIKVHKHFTLAITTIG